MNQMQAIKEPLSSEQIVQVAVDEASSIDWNTLSAKENYITAFIAGAEYVKSIFIEALLKQEKVNANN